MAQKQILIICGEPSGDLNAANLIKEIKKQDPDVHIQAVGGPLLRQAGAETFYDIKELSVLGFFDALRKLSKFFNLKKVILEKIEREKPQAIILVDFSGFNLRLAKAINNAIPVIYYISPQVWASRAGRIKTIKKYISKLIVLFEFEEQFYRQHHVTVDFTGHPLLDIVKPSISKKEFLSKFSLSESKTTIALIPGSRTQEVKRVLTVMLDASVLIQKKLPQAQFIIAKSPNVELDIYCRILRHFSLDAKIIENKTYDCLNSADFALVCSGTATLETAIMQKPFIVVYKMNCLNYFLYRPQVRIPFIGMVNIVAGKKIVPEFIQFQATPENIAAEATKILQNPALLEQMQQELGFVKSCLGKTGAGSRAARIILDFLR